MEGSESEEVFRSMNLKPQLFINEVLNSVDSLVDEAFDIFQREALMQLKTDRSGHLEKGINCIRHKIQSVLDQRLGMWEKYCLRYCFSFPSGFVFANANEPSASSLMDEEAPSDQLLDEELQSLRNKLAEVGKESADLDQELEALERQSVYGNSRSESMHGVLQFYEKNSMQDLFQEIMGTAAELKSNMEKLKNMERERSLRERMYDASGNTSVPKFSKGLLKLEELQHL